MKIETYGKVGILTQAFRKLNSKSKGWGFCGMILDENFDNSEEEM